MTPSSFTVTVQPRIPEPIRRLADLGQNLLYSWEPQIRDLFAALDSQLWEAVSHNPRLYLRQLDQSSLDRAASDPLFLRNYHSCLSSFDAYLHQKAIPELSRYLDGEHDLVAYFCAEFGVHESLPIYSGGLGILAGDHCKAASDLGVPFVAVGLLYRKGYFQQTIDRHGRQHDHYSDINFDELPIEPAQAAGGGEVRVRVHIGGREVQIKVWKARVGKTPLYLLDTDLADNHDSDRLITNQLYGGDSHMRIQQELVLGVGGVRALRALGLSPTVWHINEGHPALLVLERCRERVQQGQTYAAAFEAVAARTVFTTHTPVPAGHDVFSREVLYRYLNSMPSDLGLSEEQFMALGSSPGHEGGFNQTALALRGSRLRNGVSRVHGGVSARMSAYIWPGVSSEENPVSFITNGVHVQTVLNRNWVRVFDQYLPGEWRDKLLNGEFWKSVNDIPDAVFWATHQAIKALLLDEIHERIQRQGERNGLSYGLIKRVSRHLTPDTLLIGFARRFATYKRATLLMQDVERLVRLVAHPQRPVIFVFAGKAHPADGPGQENIRALHNLAHRPEFEGRILLLEGYDLALARHLVSGVDVWLNTPEYPLEASGTSGQKAAANGVPHLSVLDGWWAEGYEGDNGWAITPYQNAPDAAARDREEAREMFYLLDHEIAPTYYQRGSSGYSGDWVRVAKRAMISAIPRFNAQRMVMDYVSQMYGPAARLGARLAADDFRPARELAEWKQHIAARWQGVRMHPLDLPSTKYTAGEEMPLKVAVQLNGLNPAEVRVECVLARCRLDAEKCTPRVYAMEPDSTHADGSVIYGVNLGLPDSGQYRYRVRVYPHHPLLPHPFEMGRMLSEGA
jgi:starch phosphorylase